MAEDIRENAMSGGTPARLRGIDDNGNSISPALADVMAAMPVATDVRKGLMAADGFRQGLVLAAGDYNVTLPSGVYSIVNGLPDAGITTTGSLIVFKGRDYVVHFAVLNFGGIMYKTLRVTGETLRDWMSINSI